MNKMELRELLKEVDNVEKFTVFGNLFAIHLKDGTVIEIEGNNNSSLIYSKIG